MPREGTNLRQYALAAMPPGTRILGRVLRPFCLAHALLLERTANPIWCGGQVETAHLISAVWICSHIHDTARSGGDIPRMRVGAMAWLMRAWLACWIDPMVLYSRVAMLRDYIRSALHCYPEVYQVDGADAPRPETVPWPILMHMRLIALGFSHRDALNLPISQVNWILAAHASDAGRISMVSDHERELFAAADSVGRGCAEPPDRSLSA